MNGIVFYIGLGAGLAVACGLRPFLPLLLAGALGSAGDLGVSFSAEPFRFLQSSWWLLVVAVALVVAYLAQLRFGLSPTLEPGGRSRRVDPLAASIAGIGLAGGALLFGGTLATHGDSAWPGLVAGLLVVAFAQRVCAPVISGARARLADRAAREALSVYLDAASLLTAALVALLHPLGYLAVALLAWFAWRTRSRRSEKYAGLRILRR